MGLADPAVVQMVDLRQGTRLNPCCTHVDNFGKDEYEQDILDAMETRKKLFANWAAAKNNLDSCFLFATTLVSPWTPHQGTERPAAEYCCGHLSQAGYSDLAAEIVEVAYSGVDDDDGSNSMQSESDPLSRR